MSTPREKDGHVHARNTKGLQKLGQRHARESPSQLSEETNLTDTWISHVRPLEPPNNKFKPPGLGYIGIAVRKN